VRAGETAQGGNIEGTIGGFPARVPFAARQCEAACEDSKQSCSRADRGGEYGGGRGRGYQIDDAEIMVAVFPIEVDDLDGTLGQSREHRARTRALPRADGVPTPRPLPRKENTHSGVRAGAASTDAGAMLLE
jgi:hypothetical protein